MAAGVAVLAGPAPAWASFGLSPRLPSSGSLNGQRIAQLYDLISVPAIAIFLLVEALLIVIVVRFRRRRLPAGYRPPQWHSNRRLEIAWTVVPLVIVLTIGALSFGELQRDFSPSASASASASAELEITITAHQFGWDYAYPQGFDVHTEGFDSLPMMIPVGQRVRLRVGSQDVIHSWWVPDLTGKTDAVPGYDNFTWIEVDHPGRWRGQCAELCGTGHSTMLIYVRAVPQADYDRWVAQQARKTSPSPSPSSGSSPRSR
jgi:cytochrome c oxidase subunit 2